MTKVYYQLYNSPIAPIHLYANDKYLLAIAFDANRSILEKKYNLDVSVDQSSPIIAEAIRQLEEYFLGKRKEFDLPLHIRGTLFQMAAWEALQNIPYGQMLSYSEQAVLLKREKAFRAVGSANGKNPFSIVIPCHRVVGKSGSLTGYAGGKDVKAALLKVERELF